MLKAGDIVFTRVGSVDLSAYVQPHQDGWMFSSRMLRVRPNDEIDSRFLSYFFQQKRFRQYILNIAVGATMPSINTGILKGLPISYPPLPEQKAIASVLSSLDDKIDLLHRQNKTLEAMAETLFREWFVESLDKDLALLDFIDINPKESISKGQLAPYLEMKNVQTDDANPSDWYRREFKSGTKFKNGDTIMARITPCLQNGKKAFIQFLNNDEIGWGSTEYLVFRAKHGYHPFSSYLLAKNESFKSFAVKTMTGSSGRQRVQTDSLKQFRLNKPSDEKISELNGIFDDVANKLKINAIQIRTLENLRDTLLPQLMSGKIRIPTDG